MAEGFKEFKGGDLETPEGLTEMNRQLRELYDNVAGDARTIRVYKGFGTPESAVSAGIGSLFQRLDGGANTTLYVKETGTGDTGWVAK